MEIRIVIDAPNGWKRRVLFFGVTPVALVVAVALVARATVQNVDASWVASGQPVSAASFTSDLNAINNNFTTLDQRVTALETFKVQSTFDGGFSLGATFCGTGSVTNGQITNSYAGARALCQQATGCSAAAHMCTIEELARLVQLGQGPTQAGWYAAGFNAQINGMGMQDCEAWSTNTSSQFGPVWQVSPTQSPAVSTCNNAYPILCCN